MIRNSIIEYLFEVLKIVFLFMIARPILRSKKRKGDYISEALNNYADPDNQIIKSNPKLIINSKISKKKNKLIVLII